MAEELKGVFEKAVREGKAIDLDQLEKVVEKMISEDEEVRNEFSMTRDTLFNVEVEDILSMSTKIEGGKPSFSPDLAEDRDFYIVVPKRTLSQILAGEKDVMTPFMGGEIRMWREGDVGNMANATDILPLITILAEKLELKI
jgi:putative sterol carrier protein